MVSPHLLSLATPEMPTHSHVCIASRVQFMMCKPPLVFTALASVGIIKQGKKQLFYVKGQCISMAISTDTSKVVSDTLLKETTHNVWSKCKRNAIFRSEVECESQASSGCLCTVHVQEKTLHEKSPGVLC